MDSDEGFLYALAIGEKFHFPYLRYLVDDWLSQKALKQKYPDGLNVHDWAQNNLHFEALRAQKVRVDLEWNEEYLPEEEGDGDGDEKGHGDGDGVEMAMTTETQSLRQGAAELMEGAVKSWSVRCTPGWKLSPFRFNDSVEPMLRYLHSTVRWTHNLVLNECLQTVCPFQVDLSIVME